LHNELYYTNFFYYKLENDFAHFAMHEER